MCSENRSQGGVRPAIVGEMALLLHYALRHRDRGDRFTAGNLSASFPFVRYFWGEAELARLCKDLEQRGYLRAVPPRGWELTEAAPGKADEMADEAMSYLRSIAPQVLQKIPLEGFRELDRVRREDAALARFAADGTLGRKEWWQYLTQFSETYASTVDGSSPLTALATQFYSDAGLEDDPIGQPGVVDERWSQEGIAFLGAKIPKITPWKSLPAVVYFVNARRFSDQTRLTLEQTRDERMGKRPGCAHILVPLGTPAPGADDLIKTRAGFAFLWPDSLRDIALSSHSAERFRSTVKPQIDIRLISPYQLHGPVREDFFYGRNEEIGLVLSHPETNYAFYGSRRIGKTSLLMKLERLLKAQEAHAAYVDCEILDNEADFCDAVCSAMEMPAAAAIPALVSEVMRSGRSHVLLLDEVDHSLGAATLDLVLRGLRALANSGQVRLLMAGFRGLYALYRDPSTGMHNLADEVRLGGLGMRPALDLARIPMEHLGVHYEGGLTMAQKVVNLCGRHPNLIQRMCQGLVGLLSDERRSIVTDGDVEGVFAGPEFRKYVDDVFFDGLTRVEKIIVLSCPLRLGFGEHVVLENVRRACSEIPQNEVFEALSNLEVAFVLDKREKSYKYCYDQFPTILQRNHDIPQLLAELATREKEDRRRGGAPPPSGSV